MDAELTLRSASEIEQSMWHKMIGHHEKGIAHSYIPDLRASFKKYDASRTQDCESDDPLSSLRTLLFGQNLNDITDLERHSRLIIESYNIRRNRKIEDSFYNAPQVSSRCRSLWVDICLLARLRVAHQNFKTIARTLPSFRHVTCIMVPHPLLLARPTSNPLKLKATFDILNLNSDSTATKAVLGRNWTVTKSEREFTKRQKQKPNLHEEVQMLLHLYVYGSSVFGVYPYLGCSKLSCFMCHHFVKSYGRFTTRGCHGRLFRPWTVPNVNGLASGQAKKISKALISVQREVITKLKASVGDHTHLERTSHIGGSSVFDIQQHDLRPRRQQIDRLRMEAVQGRVAERFNP